MVTITPRKDKSGNISAYLIRVYRGYDSAGKRLKPCTMTWRVPPNMTPKQVKKELNRQAVQFEEQCKQGYTLNNRQTFAQYAEYVLSLKEQSGTKHRTILRYRDLLKRVNAGIGHLKLSDIRPQHLNVLYSELRKPELRKNTSKAVIKSGSASIIEGCSLLKKDIAANAGIGYVTLSTMLKGERVSLDAAEKVCVALGQSVEKLFTITKDARPLSEKSVLEHHRLISMILGTAEKEMLIQYNPASRVMNKPKDERSEDVNYFDIETLEKIRDSMSLMPLKYRVITHLLLVTGCRRGEIMGLRWSAVDLEKAYIYIKTTLLYSTEYGVYIDTTKTRSSTRIVNLPPETVELLREYRKSWQQFRKECGSAWLDTIEIKDGDGNTRQEKTDFLFLKDSGEMFGFPMHPDSITNYLGDFSKRNGLPHINPHAFRHTLASVLCFNHVDMVTISKWLGHNSVNTTMKFYQHFMEQGRNEVVNCVSDVILKKQA